MCRGSPKREKKESWMDAFHSEVSKVVQINCAPKVLILVF